MGAEKQYIEEEYIREQFVSNFLDKCSGNIVIYGTGIHTQRLLEKICTSRLKGLMDAKKTGSFLWGYPVLSEEEVAAIENVFIVIIARNAVINIIYRRIEKFCKKNHIDVYDLNGNNLHHLKENQDKPECFLLKEEDLQKKIQDADIITFDIFDTLLSRRIMRPRDIFLVMDELLTKTTYVFSKERIRAEDEISWKESPTIYDIYEQFSKNVNCPKNEIQYLINLEICTEKKFLVKRSRICELLAWAVKEEKEVYLVSDMYFPKNILEDMLSEFQITGYKVIFVSCDYGISKQDGLFEVIKKDVHMEGKACLHIGDNYYSDIVAAKRSGFETFQIFSPIEMLERSIYASCLQHCSTLEENIILSYFAVRAYQNPFCRNNGYGKLQIDTSEDAIEFFVAPVIFKYIAWLVQNLQNKDYDKVLFPSRDGYLLKLLYELVQINYPNECLPEGYYLYTSRRAAMAASVVNEEDVWEILRFDYSKGISDLLKDRFDLDIQTELKEIDEVIPYMSDILGHCKEERECYKQYIQETGINSCKKTAFLDFVAMGTIQHALQKIVNQSFTGYYFLRRNVNQLSLKRLHCYSLYEEKGDFQNDTNIYKYYYFLEAILTSYEPTFKRIQKNGQKQFYPEFRTEPVIMLLKRIHHVIYRYCDTLFHLIPNIFQADSPVNVYDDLLGFFSSDYSELNTDELNLLNNIDEFMGKHVSEINR